MKSNAPTLQRSNALRDDIVISFENVTKEFRLNKQKTFKEFLPALFGGKETVSKFNALENISFEVIEGETLGIIGPNGSGKSTILKLIAGVMSPTKGKITVNGNISPLIELGAGMHPELTGVENIFLNGAILGLSRKQIRSKLKEIVNFAELWDFIDQPVKHYSSGMYMRLAFAVAIHVDPEILIVDEIMAVGDSEFQKKCFKKMESFKSQAKTTVFVSHNFEQIKNFCSRVIYINNHHIQADGEPKEICAKYLNDLSK